MDSFTLTLSGNTSVLDAYYFPPIELSADRSYELGLVQLITYNAIPNIEPGTDKLHVQFGQTVTFPHGSYELQDIEDYARRYIPSLTIKPNHNTLKCIVSCDKNLDFEEPDSIGKLLGFSPRVLMADSGPHESDNPVSIMKVNAIRVECNITGGAYFNDQSVHTIHFFFPSVSVGYKINEVPSHIIYLPVTVSVISHLQIKFVDQRGSLVSFRGEEISVRVHIRSI